MGSKAKEGLDTPQTTKSPQDAHQEKLIKRFGETVLKGGYTCLPNLLLRYQAELYLNPTQLNIIVQIWMSWWESYPYPAITTIASRMRRGVRCIQVNLRKIERPVIDEESGEQIRPSLLTTTERFPEGTRQSSNEYDFTKLLECLEEFQESAKLAKRVSVHRTPVNLDSSPPVNLDSSPPVNLDSPHRKDESLKGQMNDRDSNLRSATRETLEGTALNSRSTSEQTNGSSKPDNQTNGNKPNKRNTKNETVTQDPQERAAAPPAWSNVQPSSEGTALPALPTYPANYLDDLSRQYHDLAPASSQTRAAKIYAQLAKWDVDDQAFVEFLHLARKSTSLANITRQNPDGSINSMPYFLKVLAELAKYNMGLWAEEDRRRAEEAKNQGES